MKILSLSLFVMFVPFSLLANEKNGGFSYTSSATTVNGRVLESAENVEIAVKGAIKLKAPLAVFSMWADGQPMPVLAVRLDGPSSVTFPNGDLMQFEGAIFEPRSQLLSFAEGVEFSLSRADLKSSNRYSCRNGVVHRNGVSLGSSQYCIPDTGVLVRCEGREMVVDADAYIC